MKFRSTNAWELYSRGQSAAIGLCVDWHETQPNACLTPVSTTGLVRYLKSSCVREGRTGLGSPRFLFFSGFRVETRHAAVEMKTVSRFASACTLRSETHLLILAYGFSTGNVSIWHHPCIIRNHAANDRQTIQTTTQTEMRIEHECHRQEDRSRNQVPPQECREECRSRAVLPLLPLLPLPVVSREGLGVRG